MSNSSPYRHVGLGRISSILFSWFFVGMASYSLSQGPSPENGATLFPGGALVSYSSLFISRRPSGSKDSVPRPASVRPSFAHQAPLTFSWGIRRDFQFTAVLPIATNRLDLPATGFRSDTGGTGLGDSLLLLKYRFLRLDSERGTTQAAITIGPKLPTGRTDLRDDSGALLPVGLQPGSGSTDLFLNVSGTYTGLFHVKRLVADGSVTYLLRSEGSQQTRQGNSMEARFWLSHRPYQSKGVGMEWFVGPSLAWQHMAKDRSNGVRESRSGGDVLYLGLTNYFSPLAGTVLWLSLDFPVAQDWNGMPLEMKRRIVFGITRQFRLHR